MSDKKKFLKLIEKDPYDLVTRKVFADYLDEYGSDSDFELAEEQRKWTKEKQEAIVWMTELAKYINEEAKNTYEYYNKSYGMTYEKLIEISNKSLSGKWSDYHNFPFNTPNRLHTDMEEFWKNFELITGISIENKEQEIFSCSC